MAEHVDFSLVLEQPIVRAGAVAAGLVAVGQVLRWLGAVVRKWLGADRVARLEKRIDDLDEKLTAQVEGIRDEAIAVAADTNERVARMEGQMDLMLSLLQGNKTQTRKIRGV